MRVIKCSDEELVDGVDDSGEEMTAEQAALFLNLSPRNAVVITSVEPHQFILCGASEEPTNYFYGDMPAEDPNDANGGFDMTALQAIEEAVYSAGQE